ncbi:hypothetical protein WA026_009086 [Henosepilachna vigintioctopunctata]|uniref:Odorant receptor n=1 Tax=Henosepilachna vigintioctopunctata TaxID=420089 RepID=A0AAW1UZ69_9CUCU
MGYIVDESFGLQLLIMKSFGMFPSNSVSKMYGYVMYILTIWIFPFLVVAHATYDNQANIISISENWFFLPEMWVLIVKIIPFLNKKDEINDLMVRIQSGTFVPRLEKHQKIVKNCARECRNLFIYFCCCAFIAILFWAAKPFYDKAKTLPIEVFLPYEMSMDHPSYYPIFIYLVLSTTYGAFSNNSIDCLIAGLLHHLSGQIKILKHKLEHVGARADQMVLHMEDLREKEEVRNIIISKLLKECIDHYDDIIRYKHDLERIFTSVPFVNLVVGAIVICISCFQLLLFDPSSTNFLGMLEFLITIICQIYMYCHYGNQLRYQSSLIGTAAYMSDWYTFDLNSKKMLIILMERAQQPLFFNAGNILPLSMATFVSILRKAYSLLAVLKKFKG